MNSLPKLEQIMWYDVIQTVQYVKKSLHFKSYFQKNTISSQVLVI